MDADLDAPMLGRLRHALMALGERGTDALPRVEALYHPDATFTDPVQVAEGRDAVVDLHRRLVTRAKHLSFDFHRSAASSDVMFWSWTLHLKPKVGPVLRLEGMSEIRLSEGLIIEHRDMWDLLGTVMGAIPVLGPAYRRLAAKLG